MNVYDEAHGLARAIKESNEFKEFDKMRHAIEQDADIVLFLFREGYYDRETGDNPAPQADMNSGECIVAKNRHGETSTVKLHWQGEFMRFTGTENKYDA